MEVLLSIAGGLALFLYAVIKLSEHVQEAVGDNAKEWLLKFTRNIYTAVATGAVVTAVAGSSSAVIILTIVLVNARTITFRQAMGIVMGANIGTTMSSQIIAVDIGKYSPVALIIGLALLMISQTARINTAGKIILFFGMLFFGLYTMERAVEPLRTNSYFSEWIAALSHPVKGALAGALITLVIQSSSATVGMAITLGKKSIISLAAGVAVMLGAELGTCSDTLLATIKGSREAVKTGLFHLIFNLLSITIGLILFYPFIYFIEWLSGTMPLERQIANAHMMFNILGVILFIGFASYFEKLLNKLLPPRA